MLKVHMEPTERRKHMPPRVHQFTAQCVGMDEELATQLSGTNPQGTSDTNQIVDSIALYTCSYPIYQNEIRRGIKERVVARRQHDITHPEIVVVESVAWLPRSFVQSP
jgi:hypothetical protein